jgi:hypothetical protein
VSDGVLVGRIFLSPAAPDGRQRMWKLAYGQHEDRTPTHGYEATREAAMKAFAKSWRHESLAPSRQPSTFSRPRRAHESLTVPVDHAAHPS